MRHGLHMEIVVGYIYRPFFLLIHSSPSSPIRKAASLFTLPSGNQRRKTYVTRWVLVLFPLIEMPVLRHVIVRNYDTELANLQAWKIISRGFLQGKCYCSIRLVCRWFQNLIGLTTSHCWELPKSCNVVLIVFAKLPSNFVMPVGDSIHVHRGITTRP